METMEYIILHNRNRRREAAAGTKRPPGNQLALGLELPDNGEPAAASSAPEQTGGRYYALTWSPAITGDGWVVERTWGPLYNHRRQRKATFTDNQAAALDFVAHHLRRRLRHGYTIRDATPAGHTLAERASDRSRRRS
jgi:hypothetical protein